MAATNINSIVIYSTVTFKEKIILRLKFGKIKHFVWNKDDEYVITCTNTGVVCIWDVDTGEKIGEYAAKALSFSQISIFLSDQASLEHVFVLDNNHEIRELSAVLNEYNNGKRLPIKGEDLILHSIVKNSKNTTNSNRFSAFTCDLTGHVLVVGKNDGHMRIMPYLNLSSTNKNADFYAHCNKIFKIKFTCDSKYLISCSSDGTIVIWRIYLPTSFTDVSKMPCLNEVLVTKSDLLAKAHDENIANSYLSQQYEIKEYDMKLKEMAYSEKIKALNYNCKINLTKLRSLITEFNANKQYKGELFEKKIEKLINMFEYDLNIIKENGEKELVEKYYQFDLLYKLYNELKLNLEKLINTNPMTINTISKTNTCESNIETSNENEEIKSIKNYYTYKIENLNKKNSAEINSLLYKIKLSQEENKQIEIEGDEEIEELKCNFNRKINFFKHNNESLQLDACFMRKKLQHNEEKVKNLILKYKKFNQFKSVRENKNNQLENNIIKLKLLLNQKMKLLMQNDEKIFKLKRQNQNCEKIRFVNEHQIVEFNNSINPLKIRNQLLAQYIANNEFQSHNLLNKIKQFNNLKEHFNEEKDKAAKNLKKIKDKQLQMKYWENFLFKAIHDLYENSQKKENKCLKLVFDRIIKHLPENLFDNQFNNYNEDVINSINKQISILNNTIAIQNKEINMVNQQTRDINVLNMKDNTFIINNVKRLETKRKELESKYARLKFQISLNETCYSKQHNFMKLIDKLAQIVNIYRLNNNIMSINGAITQIDNSNIQMRLKLIDDLINECIKTSSLLNNLLNPHDTDYLVWKNLVKKYLNLKNLTS